MSKCAFQCKDMEKDYRCKYTGKYCYMSICCVYQRVCNNCKNKVFCEGDK